MQEDAFPSYSFTAPPSPSPSPPNIRKRVELYRAQFHSLCITTRLIERGLPLEIGEIKGAFLRQNIVKNGCCGASELLKLYAWMLTDYHRVVHLDMDSLVLQSMDELFDMEMDLIYTCDYGMMTPHSKACPVQGGFFILRPDPEHYENMVGIVKEGEFNDSKGWGASGIGWFWGGMTIQGEWDGWGP